MVIFGVDPGYAIVGYGVLRYENKRFTVLDFGAVTTQAGVPFSVRLLDIFNDLTFLFDKYRPDVMSIEKLFFNTNKKTAVDVAQARGVILLAARNAGAQIYE